MSIQEGRLAMVRVMEKAARGDFILYAELITLNENELPLLPKSQDTSVCERMLNHFLGFGNQGSVVARIEWVRSIEDDL